MTPPLRPRNFLSIRWKILLLAGFVLCVTGGLFVWQQYRIELRQFDQAQAEGQVRAQELVQRLFKLQADRLQMQALMFAGLPNVRQDLIDRQQGSLERDLEGLWSELNMGQGLLAVSIYDNHQQRLAGWGEYGSAQQSRMAIAAERQERPLSWLECAQQCAYQLVTPISYRGETLGAIAVTGNLENIILDLRQLIGAEVAVFAGKPQRTTTPLSGMSLLSFSGGTATQELLNTAIHRSWQKGQVQLGLDNRIHQLMLVPVSDGLQAHLVFATDVTTQVRAIRAAARRSFWLGCIALLLGLVLLYAMLRPTMRRLQHVTGLLPLLGEERFEDVRKSYRARPRGRFPDEADELESLAVILSSRLEGLRTESREHLHDLAAQANQLERERDLFYSLFNTAPVLILTYGRDRRIRMANATAHELSGQSSGSILGQDFADIFLDTWQRNGYPQELAGMMSGNVYHGESNRLQPDGTVRDIVWFHTRLAHEAGETPAYLSVGMDVTEHRQTKHQLHKLSECDAVTGLLNRRAFKRELDALLTVGEQGTMLVCDLDQFKVVNEAEGHEAGDALLQAFAAYVETLTPTPRLMARLGSDEFALVFSELNSTDAIALARQLNHIQPQRMARLQTTQALSTCVGMVQFPMHGQDADTLLGSAQFALLQAQDKGHGSWHLYSADDPQRDSMGKRAHWKREVERALEDGRLVLHFQPIRNIAKGTISHYEALLRLVGEDGKLVMPGDFIEAAESTGLIRRVDRWVIEAVVAFAAGRPEFKVALNLSGRSFDDDLAFETMKAALKRHGVKGKNLQLEITETAALANMSKATRVMAQLRGLGCAFGLDDFGVGYSSFQYLKELPIDFVKIDGSFIRGLTSNADDVMFVRALNNAVQGYGKTTVAEFVEDEATLALLREIGVDCAQGYLIGRPAATLI